LDSKRTLTSFIIPELILSNHMTDSLGRLKINTSKVECRHKRCITWKWERQGSKRRAEGNEDEGEVKKIKTS